MTHRTETTDNHRYCVIMCGGIGSRFWPYSRSSMPKQFIDFFGTGQSLLQMTYERMLPLVDTDHIFIATNDRYRSLISQQLPQIPESRILYEPARRSTAPTIVWASHHIAAIDPEAVMIVTPCDHLITRERVFEEEVRKGFEFVEKNPVLLTLGITPTRPDTGYGYIQVGSPISQGGICKVKTFTEKPTADLAQVFVESGEFLWNAGIFLWQTKAIIEAIHRYLPDLSREFDRGSSKFGTEREIEFINSRFPRCPNISIDFGVMEKAENVYVERGNFGWSDIGTWGSLYDSSPKTREGNVAQGCRSLTYNASGNIFAVDKDKLVVVNGLHDYIIAESGDVLLVCPRSEEQKLRQIVNDVKLRFDDKYM